MRSFLLPKKQSKKIGERDRRSHIPPLLSLKYIHTRNFKWSIIKANTCSYKPKYLANINSLIAGSHQEYIQKSVKQSEQTILVFQCCHLNIILNILFYIYKKSQYIKRARGATQIHRTVYKRKHPTRSITRYSQSTKLEIPSE